MLALFDLPHEVYTFVQPEVHVYPLPTMKGLIYSDYSFTCSKNDPRHFSEFVNEPR